LGIVLYGANHDIYDTLNVIWRLLRLCDTKICSWLFYGAKTGFCGAITIFRDKKQSDFPMNWQECKGQEDPTKLDAYQGSTPLCSETASAIPRQGQWF
jgi:hypothetical protein